MAAGNILRFSTYILRKSQKKAINARYNRVNFKFGCIRGSTSMYSAYMNLRSLFSWNQNIHIQVPKRVTLQRNSQKLVFKQQNSYLEWEEIHLPYWNPLYRKEDYIMVRRYRCKTGKRLNYSWNNRLLSVISRAVLLNTSFLHQIQSLRLYPSGNKDHSIWIWLFYPDQKPDGLSSSSISSNDYWNKSSYRSSLTEITATF